MQLRQGGQCLADVVPLCRGAVLESDGSCVLVGWQDSSDSDGLVTDDDRLLVAGVGDHGRVIINIRAESDTYNGRQCNNFIGDGFICTAVQRPHLYSKMGGMDASQTE